MKSVLIGTVAFSQACLNHLVALGEPPAGVVTRPSSKFNADYADLRSPAEQAGIPVLQITDINQPDCVSWIAAHAPDVIFCFGWSQLLSQEILDIAPIGVIGYHPALLPRGRGRHPIIWTLVLGLKETGSTFFFMDDGADTGDILSQERLAVRENDDATSLYATLTDTALTQIADFVPRLSEGSYDRLPQDAGAASSWRKRSAADGQIDWRMPTAGIHNLVRALARPYPGATLRRGETDQIIWRTGVSEYAAPKEVEPGRVLAANDDSIVVKTGDGAITLIEHELTPHPRTGEYL